MSLARRGAINALHITCTAPYTAVAVDRCFPRFAKRFCARSCLTDDYSAVRASLGPFDRRLRPPERLLAIQTAGRTGELVAICGRRRWWPNIPGSWTGRTPSWVGDDSQLETDSSRYCKRVDAQDLARW